MPTRKIRITCLTGKRKRTTAATNVLKQVLLACWSICAPHLVGLRTWPQACKPLMLANKTLMMPPLCFAWLPGTMKRTHLATLPESKLLCCILTCCKFRCNDAQRGDHGQAAVAELLVAKLVRATVGLQRIAVDVLLQEWVAQPTDLLDNSGGDDHWQESFQTYFRSQYRDPGWHLLKAGESDKVLREKAHGREHRHTPVLKLSLAEPAEALLVLRGQAQRVEVSQGLQRADLCRRVERCGSLELGNSDLGHVPPISRLRVSRH
mmetsp:Transcript_124566/g.311491  ORF Transcript_124566/g.311491 Transcript_124566/m.311491 type:complete len:264 (+) Transcript_124566:193-984(+)